MRISVQARTGRGRNYELDVQPTTTVSQLRQQLLDKTGDTNEMFSTFVLTFNGDVLIQENDTLESYGIEQDSELELVAVGVKGRNLGSVGSHFVDVSDADKLKPREWSNSAPRWRMARSGLCLEGLCTTDGCDAFNKKVIMPIGYKRFDILGDSAEDTTYCPICKKYIQPIDVGFSNCWWRFDGIKVDEKSRNKAPTKCSSDWSQTGNAYYCFPESSSQTVSWNKLIIEAVKRKPN